MCVSSIQYLVPCSNIIAIIEMTDLAVHTLVRVRKTLESITTPTWLQTNSLVVINVYTNINHLLRITD